MTTPVIPRVTVAPPPPALRQEYGLFSAATILEDPQVHELTGVEYEAVCNVRVDPAPAPCLPLPDGMTRRKIAHPTVSPYYGGPFVMYAADECVLGRDETTARRQLRQRFLAGEQFAVERTVATGEAGNTPALEPDAQILSTRALSLQDAVGLLESWMARAIGGAGVIHAPQHVAYFAPWSTMLVTKGPRAQTLFGTTWSFGAGYTGAPPAAFTGTDNQRVWLYATAPVTIRRSPLIEPAGWSDGAFDIRQNAGFLLDERSYVVDWPCGTAAVETLLERVTELADLDLMFGRPPANPADLNTTPAPGSAETGT